MDDRTVDKPFRVGTFDTVTQADRAVDSDRITWDSARAVHHRQRGPRFPARRDLAGLRREEGNAATSEGG
jgi:hypothetical protein